MTSDALEPGINPGIRRTVALLQENGAEWARIVEWIAAGANPTERPTTEDGCGGMAIQKGSKHIYLIQGKQPIMYRLYDKIHVAGTGGDFALAAMRLGKSAEEAIRIAHEFDAYTGAEVDVVDLDAYNGRS